MRVRIGGPALLDLYAEYTPERAAHAARPRRRPDPPHRRTHRPARGTVLLPHLAGIRRGERGRVADGPLPLAAQRAHGLGRHRGRHQPQRLEQVHPGATQARPSPRPVERHHLAGRVPAGPPRAVDAPPPLPEGGSGPPRHLLHPGLQPGLDEPGRVLVAGGPDRRGARGLPRRPDPVLVGDLLVRGLRPPHGRRRRTPRRRVLRDPRRPLDRLPPTRVQGLRGAAGSDRRPHLARQPRGGLGGERVVDRPRVPHRP